VGVSKDAEQANKTTGNAMGNFFGNVDDQSIETMRLIGNDLCVLYHRGVPCCRRLAGPLASAAGSRDHGPPQGGGGGRTGWRKEIAPQGNRRAARPASGVVTSLKEEHENSAPRTF